MAQADLFGEPVTPVRAADDGRPGPGDDCGRWNAWVAAGADKDARRARFTAVPADHRDEVVSHLKTLAHLRERMADPAFQQWSATVRAQQAADRHAAGQRKPSDP